MRAYKYHLYLVCTSIEYIQMTNLGTFFSSCDKKYRILRNPSTLNKCSIRDSLGIRFDVCRFTHYFSKFIKHTKLYCMCIMKTPSSTYRTNSAVRYISHFPLYYSSFLHDMYVQERIERNASCMQLGWTICNSSAHVIVFVYFAKLHTLLTKQAAIIIFCDAVQAKFF